MAKDTKINWADSTFNPWIGCTKIGPGCDNCYAKADFEDRRQRVVWGAGNPRSRTKTWGDPVRWNSQHAAFFAKHGRRRRVFCASLADVFDNEVPNEWRTDLWDLIRATPNLDWLLVTKRIGNAYGMLPLYFNAERYPHVWLGITVTSQEEADRDIPKLLGINSGIKFLSMEPLLGAIQLGEHGLHGGPGQLDWVIVGGESGPNARPMHPIWVDSIRKQCESAGVPFLFKQWGEWIPRTSEFTSPLTTGEYAGDADPYSEKWPCMG